MKSLILLVVLGVALACPSAAYAIENSNTFDALFFGSDHSHRAHRETVDPQWSNAFTPRRTDGLSSDIDACARYGCVGAGGD